jgi:single-stranded DNA-binding protein
MRCILAGRIAIHFGSTEKGADVIDGLVSGRLVGVAEQREGKNATRFAVAKVRATAGDGESVVVNVIAFAPEACAALLALDDGDSVALAGALTPKVWSDKQGNTKPALDMVASRVLTAYPSREE